MESNVRDFYQRVQELNSLLVDGDCSKLLGEPVWPNAMGTLILQVTQTLLMNAVVQFTGQRYSVKCIRLEDAACQGKDCDLSSLISTPHPQQVVSRPHDTRTSASPADADEGVSVKQVCDRSQSETLGTSDELQVAEHEAPATSSYSLVDAGKTSPGRPGRRKRQAKMGKETSGRSRKKRSMEICSVASSACHVPVITDMSNRNSTVGYMAGASERTTNEEPAMATPALELHTCIFCPGIPHFDSMLSLLSHLAQEHNSCTRDGSGTDKTLEPAIGNGMTHAPTSSPCYCTLCPDEPAFGREPDLVDHLVQEHNSLVMGDGARLQCNLCAFSISLRDDEAISSGVCSLMVHVKDHFDVLPQTLHEVEDTKEAFSSVNVSQVDEKCSQSAAPRRRGRPPKNRPEQLRCDSSLAKGTVNKVKAHVKCRKRGRPKKAKLVEKTSCDMGKNSNVISLEETQIKVEDPGACVSDFNAGREHCTESKVDVFGIRTRRSLKQANTDFNHTLRGQKPKQPLKSQHKARNHEDPALSSRVLRYKVLKCFMCADDDTMVYKTRRDLCKHVLDKHASKAKTGNSVKIACSFCSMALSCHRGQKIRLYLVYRNLANILQHMVRTHKMQVPDYIQPYFCEKPGCGYVAVRGASLESHSSIHEDKVSCDKCGKLLQPTSLNIHIQNKVCETDIKARQALKCSFCDKKFLGKQSRQQHVKLVHEKRRDFICHVCSMLIGDRQSLDCHLYSKHGVISGNRRVYQCELCSYTSLKLSIIGKHKKAVHEGSYTSYPCETCGKTLRSAGGLTMHVKLCHSGTRDYKCPRCDYAAKCNGALKEHISAQHSHQKAHTCPAQGCNYGSGYKGNLRKHQNKCPRWLAQTAAQESPEGNSPSEHVPLVDKGVGAQGQKKNNPVGVPHASGQIEVEVVLGSDEMELKVISDASENDAKMAPVATTVESSVVDTPPKTVSLMTHLLMSPPQKSSSVKNERRQPMALPAASCVAQRPALTVGEKVDPPSTQTPAHPPAQTAPPPPAQLPVVIVEASHRQMSIGESQQSEQLQNKTQDSNETQYHDYMHSQQQEQQEQQNHVFSYYQSQQW